MIDLYFGNCTSSNSWFLHLDKARLLIQCIFNDLLFKFVFNDLLLFLVVCSEGRIVLNCSRLFTFFWLHDFNRLMWFFMVALVSYVLWLLIRVNILGLNHLFLFRWVWTEISCLLLVDTTQFNFLDGLIEVFAVGLNQCWLRLISLKVYCFKTWKLLFLCLFNFQVGVYFELLLLRWTTIIIELYKLVLRIYLSCLLSTLRLTIGHLFKCRDAVLPGSWLVLMV